MKRPMQPWSGKSRGEINILLIPFIFLLLFFIAAAGFGLWAYSSREDYRTHTDQKVAAAVKVAKEEEGIVKDKEHAEADKQPLKTYAGPEESGSLRISYPKTWSGYVDTAGNSNQPLDGFFQPGVVPSISDQSSVFALRVQVINQSYSSIVTQLNNGVTNNKMTAVPYAFPKVPNVVGIRYDGQIQQNEKTNGSMVVVPLRDKTLQVWTESPIYINDFNNNILPNLTFSP